MSIETGPHPTSPNHPDNQPVNLRLAQRIIGEWAQRNFGSNFSTSRNIHLGSLAPLLGIGEELGELHHAVLKEAQGIRGYQSRELYEEDRDDALADLVIFLLDFCYREGVDFDSVFNRTLAKVLKRDWTEERDVPQAPNIQNAAPGSATFPPAVPVPSASSHPHQGTTTPFSPDGRPHPTLSEADGERFLNAGEEKPQPLPGDPEGSLDERVETILEEMEDTTPPDCEG